MQKLYNKKGHEVKIDISAFETYKLHGGYQLDKYNIDLDSSIKDENDKFYKNNLCSKIIRKIDLNL